MNPLLDAAHPRFNASVSASAGTGKTWLLVTRMIRLLLAGARPDGLLAVTFTRKAAAEMHSRLLETLCRFATVTDETLSADLARIDVSPTPEAVRTARGLYESLLRSARSPRTTTFHAFCNDLLKRFPLEASVTPGFELIESTKIVEHGAVQALYAEATLNPDGAIAAALESLYERFGHASTEDVLQYFLDHRSEWWAYTQSEADPPGFARERLRRQLRVESDTDDGTLFLAAHEAGLREFAELLDKHATKTNQADADIIRSVLASDAGATERIARILPVFLKADSSARARKQSAAQARSMGSVAEQRFLSLHDQLGNSLATWVDALRARETLALSGAWFIAGSRLLENFQRLKEEQRVLDFSDLEWRTFVLLTSNGHAHWVQYKLDQRIDHLLIDEFQDTSPVQWHMIFPLLEELAGAADARNRTVFLVGDEKQSIYQFRRADPRLFRVAQDWLASRLGARTYGLDSSRRSAPAIVALVNAVFNQPALRDHFPHFPTHETHRHDLWGHVELLPLAEPADDAEPRVSTTTELRNPLLQPRAGPQRTAHDAEAETVARKILDLVNGATPIGPRGDARPVAFSDILILLRSRTHVGAIERALRAAHIPYSGAARGTLLQSREISDLVDLLDVLSTPFNNLVLATVLRSPLFSCSEDHLAQLALMGETGTWAQRLATLAPSLEESHPLRRAQHWISRWSDAAGHLPVHDLIDRIYSEGRVVQRYAAAAPLHLRASVRGNLEQFVELALALDSGRYPSLGRFVESTRAAQRGDTDGPDADTLTGTRQGVRIMTIHAAKGLEAPVVFLVDTMSDSRRGEVANVFITWDPMQDRPDRFFIAGSRAGLDALSRELDADNERRRRREDLNLLYVALTRARQFLYVSGSAPSRPRNNGWHNLLRDGLAALAGDSEVLFHSDVEPPSFARVPADERNIHAVPVDPALGRPLPPSELMNEIAPSRHDLGADARHVDAPDAGGADRGIAIHRLMEMLCESAPDSEPALRGAVTAALHREVGEKEYAAWRDEAERVVRSPELRSIFDKARFTRAYAEVPLSYMRGGRVVNGVVDRIVVRDDEVVIVDFKTHRVGSADAARALANQFGGQLAWYARGAAALWPGKTIRTIIVVTSLGTAIELKCPAPDSPTASE